jgi:hypothetical protein
VSDLVRHRCYSDEVPTKRPRHAITETPPIQEALDELRRELGDEPLRMSELVILGAEEKLARLRAERDDIQARRRRLADRIRAGEVLVDVEAADEVRRTGWARG